jgi:hypothetical protein
MSSDNDNSLLVIAGPMGWASDGAATRRLAQVLQSRPEVNSEVIGDGTSDITLSQVKEAMGRLTSASSKPVTALLVGSSHKSDGQRHFQMAKTPVASEERVPTMSILHAMMEGDRHQRSTPIDAVVACRFGGAALPCVNSLPGRSVVRSLTGSSNGLPPRTSDDLQTRMAKALSNGVLNTSGAHLFSLALINNQESVAYPQVQFKDQPMFDLPECLTAATDTQVPITDDQVARAHGAWDHQLGSE